jgi:phage structural protein
MTYQDSEKLISLYRLRLFLVSGGWSFAGYNCTGYIQFDDRQIPFSCSAINPNSEITLIDQVGHSLWHKPDGTKTAKVSVVFNGQGGYSPNRLEITPFDLTPPPIPLTSKSVEERYEAYFGQQITINIKRQKESFKHKLRFEFGNIYRDIVSNIDTSYTWTVPTDIINQIGPTATSGNGEIYIDTYDGDRKVGTTSVPLLLKVNTTGASNKPTFTDIELIETNQNVKNVLGTPNVFLQILSNIQCNFKDVVGSFGAAVNRYHAEIVGKNLSVDSNNGKFGLMNFVGDITISAYVIDERGIKSDIKTKTVKVLPYFSPTILFTAERVGQNKSIINTRTTCKVANLNINGSQKNSITVRFSTSSDGGQTFTPNGGDADFASNQTMEAVNRLASLRGDFTPKSSFVIRATISDKLSPPVSYDYPIGTEEVAISYHREGVGIGMVHNNKKYRVQVAPGDVSIEQGVYRIKDKEIQNHQITETNGTCIKYNSGDANTILKTGFYNVNNCSNMPNNDLRWWYLTVIANADTYVMQQANSFFNDKIYTRQKRGNQWSNWVALQQESTVVKKEPEWVKVNGENGLYARYKVIEGVVYVHLIADPFTESKGSSVNLPGEFCKNFVGSYMLSGVVFGLDPLKQLLIQFNPNGQIAVLNAEKGKTLKHMFSFAI